MAKPKNRSSKNKGRRGDTRRSAGEFFRGFVSSTRRGAPASQKTVAVVCLVLLLASAIAMGGAVKGRWFGARPAPATTSPVPQGTLTLSKEYIYGPAGQSWQQKNPRVAVAAVLLRPRLETLSSQAPHRAAQYI